MTILLEKAIEKVKELPVAEQDALAQMILDELESEQKWDERFSKTPEKLARLGDKALAEYDAGRTRPLNSDSL